MKIIAANFKTNHNRYSTKEYIDFVEEFISKENISDRVFVFPPSTALLRQRRNIIIGAQNAYPIFSGSFTGEIGITQLDEFDIKTILIGHSERRHILKEDQKTVALKYNYYKALGYTIIYCIGEPLEVKEAGVTETLGYIWEQFDGIDLDYDNLILAYEPVWAIGTGVSATTDDIATIHKKIKKKINKPLLYGGSVKVTNAQEVLALDGVDGVLVGSAALYAEHFCSMIQFAQDLEK